MNGEISMEKIEENRTARNEAANAIIRLEQMQATAIDQYNKSVSELSTNLESWARGASLELPLTEAFSRLNNLKSMTYPAPYRLAKDSLETEIMRLDEEINKLHIQINRERKILEYKKLFNAAVANGKKLSKAEEVKLKTNTTAEYQTDLHKLFMALNDFTFKYKGRTANPTFQEFSKIEFYPVADVG
jgi:DNA repair ATPase RecN